MFARKILTSLAVLALFDSPALAADTITYKISVQNVTAANVLSPFIAVVHKPEFCLVEVGQPATPGLAALAETGNRATLSGELSHQANVLATAQAEGGPIGSGTARSVTITVPRSAVAAGAKVDIAAMIGLSNDSFVALGGLTLSSIGNGVRVRASNFDAGSESNTGNVEDFGSGGHPTDAAEGIVSYDRGLNLRGTASELYGWGPVAALVTITRQP